MNLSVSAVRPKVDPILLTEVPPWGAGALKAGLSGPRCMASARRLPDSRASRAAAGGPRTAFPLGSSPRRPAS